MAGTEADRYREAKAIACAALERPSGERIDWVAAACGADEALRREVLWLIEAAEDPASDEVPASVRHAARRAVETVRLEAPLPRNYRLIRRLDRGGMGVVYRAVRVDGDLQQEVALKLLHLGLGHDDALARRFAAEQRILASLSHPNIAHLVDSGLTAEGQPFLAMEYVEGERIDRWCERSGLSLRERIELFLKVCAAVEYAHRHLVIHRDIKPANILVTADGEPKLLDFGIARLLDDDAEAARTRTNLQALTPAYASPEQIEGHALSTATDIYSLGVVLYELVAGVRPFDHVGSAHQLSSVIAAGDVVPPSRHTRRRERATAVGASSEDAAGPRSSARRRIPPDIDAIVLKAMRRDPAQRYASVAELAGDLRAFLGSRPVRARRGHWLYRAQRFAGRRRGVLAAVLTVAVLLIGFMLHREAQLERIARERDRAEAETAKAAQVSDFLTGLFRSADPRQARGAELTARELLDRGVEQVDRELTNQPEIQASMLHVLGRTYLELGHLDAAERLLTRALELGRSRLGAEHPDVVATLDDVALLRHRQGDYEAARDRFEETIGILEGSGVDDTPELARALKALAGVYRDLGRFEQSRATLERALSVQRRVSGEVSEPMSWIYYSLGALLYEMGDAEQAERFYERALGHRERVLGPDDPTVGRTLDDVANARVSQGKLEGVEAMYRRSLDILRNAYGPVHANVGMTLNNLGSFLVVSGRHAEAMDVLQESLDVMSRALGPKHPRVAQPLAGLGDTHLAAGRLHKAREHYRRSVAVREEAFTSRRFDPILFHGLAKLGRIEAELGNRVAAEETMDRAVEAWDHARTPTDPRIGPVLLDLGRSLTEQRRCTEAVPVMQRALRTERARQKPSNARVAELESLLDECDTGSARAVVARSLD